MYFKLVGKEVVPCSFEDWVAWFETSSPLFDTVLGDREVSTIFIGIAMNPFLPDQLFETIVFVYRPPRRSVIDQRRWKTYEEAEVGHMRLVAKVERELDARRLH